MSIPDERLHWLIGTNYIRSEPGQLAEELLKARARIRELEANLAEVRERATAHYKALVAENDALRAELAQSK